MLKLTHINFNASPRICLDWRIFRRTVSDLRDAGGQTEDLLEVVPPPEVIRPGELPLRLPESEVRLLLDPVLNPGLVPGDGLELEHEEHSHGYDNPQGEPQPKQSAEQGPECEDDLGQ